MSTSLPVSVDPTATGNLGRLSISSCWSCNKTSANWKTIPHSKLVSNQNRSFFNKCSQSKIYLKKWTDLKIYFLEIFKSNLEIFTNCMWNEPANQNEEGKKNQPIRQMAMIWTCNTETLTLFYRWHLDRRKKCFLKCTRWQWCCWQSYVGDLMIRN